MARNEKTSARVAAIAQRILLDPLSATASDIRSVAASVLTQCRDRKPRKGKAKRKTKLR